MEQVQKKEAVIPMVPVTQAPMESTPVLVKPDVTKEVAQIAQATREPGPVATLLRRARTYVHHRWCRGRVFLDTGDDTKVCSIGGIHAAAILGNDDDGSKIRTNDLRNSPYTNENTSNVAQAESVLSDVINRKYGYRSIPVFNDNIATSAADVEEMFEEAEREALKRGI